MLFNLPLKPLQFIFGGVHILAHKRFDLMPRCHSAVKVMIDYD